MFKTIKGGLPTQLISRRASLGLLAAIVSLGSASQASAATINWNGGSGNFSDSTKWSTGAVPGSSDRADIYNAGSVVTIDSAVTFQSAYINYYVGGASTLNIAAGANATVSSYVFISGGTSFTSTLNVSGGYLTSGTFSMGHVGAVVVNVSGGTLNSSGSIVMGQNSSSANTINLTGTGVVNATEISLSSATGGVGVLNVGTGAQAGALNVPSIYVGSGSGSGSVNFNHTNAVTNSAVIAGNIAVTKAASGITTLTGTNTYSGATTISAGTLLVNNIGAGSGTGTGAVTVAHLAKLGGSGRVSGSITANGVIAPGALNAVGTLYAGGNVTWNGQAADAWQFDVVSVGSFDQLVIAGALIKGTGAAGAFVFDFLGGGSVGTYNLISFGSSTFASGDFAATNLQAGYSASFAKTASNVSVTITGTPVPEPSTYAVIAGAVILGVVVIRRRKMAVAAAV